MEQIDGIKKIEKNWKKVVKPLKSTLKLKEWDSTVFKGTENACN